MSREAKRIGLLAAAGLSLALSGCTGESSPKPALAAAGEAERCIAVERIVARRPLDGHTLRFEMLGGSDYLNRLPNECPGLANAGRLDIVQLEISGAPGGQVCTGDRFRVIDPQVASVVGSHAFAECRLGPFLPVAQAE